MMPHICPVCRSTLQVVLSGDYGICHRCSVERGEFGYVAIGNDKRHPYGLTLGRAGRDEGMALVVENAGPDVLDAHLDLIRRLAERMQELTGETVRNAAEAEHLEKPHSANAYGAYMSIAARRGIIQSTDRTVSSSRPNQRAHRNPVWRSLVYRPVVAEQVEAW